MTTQYNTAAEPSPRDAGPTGSGGNDLALLALRLMVAAGMGAHGLITVFGAFGGEGLNAFGNGLRGYGFTSHLGLLSWVTGITEVGGGALLVIGLFTPLAAAGLLSVAISAVAVKFHGGFFEKSGRGFELELAFAVIAFAVLLSGAGRISLDVNTPWRKRPLRLGLVGLVLAVALAVVALVVFR
jgi:putative oxidoreductase